MNACIVIPSNREVDAEILDALAPHDVAIVEAPGFTRPEASDRVHLLDRETQKLYFGDDFHLLGHGSAAVRNFGVWWAYHQQYDMVINLDDDCYPPPGFVEDYELVLSGSVQADELETLGRWVSTLDNPATPGAWYPRGFPYEERLRGHMQFIQGQGRRPAVHCGLWAGTLDLAAVDKVAYHREPPGPVSPGYYVTRRFIPLCAMNFGCLRGYAPFVYQIPWTKFDTTLPLWRYDDIIGGLITCGIAQLEHAWIGFGPPFVDHRKKDGDLLAHAAAENLGNVVISRLAELVEQAVEAALHYEATDTFDRARLLLDCLGKVSKGHELERVCNYVIDSYVRWLEHFSRG